jgi:hypothetical protein
MRQIRDAAMTGEVDPNKPAERRDRFPRVPTNAPARGIYVKGALVKPK